MLAFLLVYESKLVDKYMKVISFYSKTTRMSFSRVIKQVLKNNESLLRITKNN